MTITIDATLQAKLEEYATAITTALDLLESELDTDSIQVELCNISNITDDMLRDVQAYEESTKREAEGE